MRTILLLLASNVFMTFAWYFHLKQDGWPLWKAILISWGIAFFEYILMVPANRIGYAGKGFSGFQLKNDTGSNNAGGVYSFCSLVSEGAVSLAIPCKFCAFAGSSFFYVQ